MGDKEYIKVGKEIEIEKVEEDKIENKIRQLRKAKNKARLHPTKESGPSMKRRKTSWGRTNWRQRKGPQESKVLEKVPCEEKRPG